LTFHGGTNVIGYPWGSNNHSTRSKYTSGYLGDESPDDATFSKFGLKMRD